MMLKGRMTRRLGLAALCFTILYALIGCDSAGTLLSRDLEQDRVTSPSGGWDAVLVRADAGGAAGGWEYYVYIVRRGSLVNTNERPVFEAGTLTNGTLLWSHPHLLDIRYNVAEIDQFTNYWDSSRLRPDRQETDSDFTVEIRLVPSSPDYSLLGPTGAFRSKE
jgi:hypothetical protein